MEQAGCRVAASEKEREDNLDLRDCGIDVLLQASLRSFGSFFFLRLSLHKYLLFVRKSRRVSCHLSLESMNLS